EINYDSPRGGVSVITEKGDITTSYLLIQRARKADTGVYTCSPSNANPQSINVHVLNVFCNVTCITATVSGCPYTIFDGVVPVAAESAMRSGTSGSFVFMGSISMERVLGTDLIGELKIKRKIIGAEKKRLAGVICSALLLSSGIVG
uniref:Ig-like domain-containing protein n=1 Tax=Megaselia scalaris TaxID=36166 RepID=T1GW98_MEGSC